VTPTQPHPARAPAATAAVLPRGRWAMVLEYRGGSCFALFTRISMFSAVGFRKPTGILVA
jgi:hypothetical protein